MSTGLHSELPISAQLSHPPLFSNFTNQPFPLHALGSSLLVQWLRLHAPNAGGSGSIPAQGTRYHMLQSKIPHAATKTWHSQINTFFFFFTKRSFCPQLTNTLLVPSTDHTHTSNLLSKQ